MVMEKNRIAQSRLAPLFIPLALMLGLSACSTAGDDEADQNGADGGQGFDDDDGAAGTGQDGAADGFDDDGFDDGGEDGGGDTGGAADDGDDGSEPPDEPEPVEPPDEPVECNDVDAVTLFLSPDDSNSMSSPVQARSAILDGFSSINAVAIRTWEFLNYYSFAYPPATEAGRVELYTDLMPRAGGESGEYVMQIGVASEDITNENRDPIAITLVLDTSGSMAGVAMDMLKESCTAIAASLKEGDTISMVTWSTENATVLGGYSVMGPNDTTVLGKCDELEAGGGTDLHGGLVAGYELAEQVFQPGQINRIVLISDGGANAGVTDIDLIAEYAQDNDGDGIYMVGVGVGEASKYNDDLMDEVTDAGKGASVFITEAAEAGKVFTDQFVSTMGVAARDVQVRLDMPAGFEVVKFSGEEISGDPSEVEPQHLSPSDTMVFHQEISTCAPDLVDDDTEFTVTVSYTDAGTFEAREVSQTLTFGEMTAGDHALLLKGAAIFQYAESLKLIQQGDDGAADLADAALVAAQAANPEDADLAEIASILSNL